MALCQATCAHGGPCTYKAKAGSTMCGKHKNQAVQVPVQDACGVVKTNGTACARPREPGCDTCGYHRKVAERAAARLRIQVMWGDAMAMLWDTNDVDGARARIHTAYTRGDLSEDQHRDFAEMLEEEIAYRTAFAENDVVLLGTPPHVTAENPDLADLARDNQNVHTSAVNKQTLAGLEMFLKMEVPAGLNTPAELAEVWSDKSTLADVRKWYRLETCREPDDHLYQRALDGLWTHIKTSPHREELTQRLLEECSESRGKCCDGHLARLCNVLVGFDDSVKAPVPAGEILQQRMAAIAGMELETHQKVGEAWRVFDELAVPMGERMAWLEAL